MWAQFLWEVYIDEVDCKGQSEGICMSGMQLWGGDKEECGGGCAQKWGDCQDDQNFEEIFFQLVGGG